ncbi:MAG: trichohyalin-plectin-homology domain domain-containing protein [Treponema sp.]|nr:trichohyalin-plectin-homology domain domain-containing protein [Treponema sp.]
MIKRFYFILIIFGLFAVLELFAQETNQRTENNNTGEAVINSDEESERRREERRLQREAERRQIEEERIKNAAINRELEERRVRLEAERVQLEIDRRRINNDLTRQNQSEAERLRQQNAAAELERKLAEEERRLAEEEKRLADKKKAEKKRKANMFWVDNGKKLWSVGLNIGSSFASPLAIGNINITAGFLPNIFLEAGFDYGFIHGRAGDIEIFDIEYYSFYYYTRINYFSPFKNNTGGFYAGLGGGLLDSHYDYKDPQTKDSNVSIQNWALDLASGIYYGRGNHLFRIGYALRTNFKAMNHRLMLGYTLRIGPFN